MRKALPGIREDLESLKQRLQHAHAGRKRPRRHRRYLLASGPAQTRGHVAPLLGVHRNPIGHWLALYETGGLEALLDVYIPAGGACAGSPAAGRVCLLCSAAPMGQADPLSGGQLSPALHERSSQGQGPAQGAAPQSPKNTLTPGTRFRRAVRSSCSVASRQRRPAQYASSARTKVGWAC